MKIIHTDQTLPTSLDEMEREWVYNGLDCCVPIEVMNALLPQFDPYTAATYDLSRALQGPALEMRLRGVLVDQHRKQQVIEDLRDQLEILERNLDRIVLEGVGLPSFNWRSYPDLHRVFYDRLRIPAIKKGGRATVEQRALERLEEYLIARPIARHITALRTIGGKLKVLLTAIDRDGRIRTSYNIAGTNTGRFSSSFSEFGTGGNLQNVEEALRSIFIADPGMKLAKFDAKSGESYVVGGIEWNLFGDDRYLKACESGDPHTATAKLCWPRLPWTGDLKRDKDIAEQPFYRNHTYRRACKVIGHGSNYDGKPPTLSKETGIDERIIREFQPKYFLAYPAHKLWHEWVDLQLRKVGHLIALSGRKRWFFGRRNDPETLRGAIAFDPQGSLADIVNRGMLNVWHHRDAVVYMHDHDAITVQFPAEREDEVVPWVLKQLEYSIQLKNGRTLLIPYDCKTGWNKGDYSDKNPGGLKDFYGHDSRRRAASRSFLDHVA